MLPESSTWPTALFHGCEKHLKHLECVAGVTGVVVLKVRCLQATVTLCYRQKGTDSAQLRRWQISFLLPQNSRSLPKTLAKRSREGGLCYCRLVVFIQLI